MIARSLLAFKANSRLCSASSRFETTLSNEDIMKYLSTPPYVLPSHKRVVAPPMVYISGEEMTNYTMNLILEKWIKPHVNISKWEFYDLSCKSRDETADSVLHDAVEAGKRLGSIFKEPTITPSATQVKEMKLSKAWGSPNGAMRRGWNGITISRDTIHIEGVKLGFESPVFFERHAVGGEYGAGWKSVGSGRLVSQFFPSDGGSPVLCDDRLLQDDSNVVVTYHNPLDNVGDLAHHFFSRCLAAKVTPYIVTKKTVFKWQEGFWTIMKKVFDDHYKQKYMDAGIIPDGNLQHLISDAATMQIIRWTKGGFGMAAHNYDGDMLTDEVAQVHRSPGFITSTLIGKREDGALIKEFEASHGTVSDLWHKHLKGEETSMNPLGLVEALIGAMNHSADLLAAAPLIPTGSDASHHKSNQTTPAELERFERNQVAKTAIYQFTDALRKSLHNTFRYGQGTRDMAGPEGLTTEEFINKVSWRLGRYMAFVKEEVDPQQVIIPQRSFRRNYNVDKVALQALFDEYDVDKDGNIDVNELEAMLMKLGVAPLQDPIKRVSISEASK